MSEPDKVATAKFQLIFATGKTRGIPDRSQGGEVTTTSIPDAAAIFRADLYALLDHLRDSLEVDLAAILRIQGDHFRPWASTGLDDELCHGAFSLHEPGLVSRIALERAPQQAPAPGNSDDATLKALNATSILGVPVEVGARLVGVLLVGVRHPRVFSLADEVMLRRVAASAAFGVDYAGLLQAAERECATRKAAEEELCRSELRFRALFDHSPEAVFLLAPYDNDLPLRIVDCNAAAAAQNGYSREELIGQPLSWLEAVNPTTADPPTTADQIRTAGVLRLIKRHRRRDGETLYIERALSLVELGDGELVLAFDHDVTDRRRLEEQLRQAQKMEAIGRLTGGVAHDFNNMLSVIGGYSELLLLDSPPDSPNRERIEEIQKATQRAADLTRQLLLFSRRERPQLGPLSLNDAINDLTKMIGRLIGEDIALVARFDPDLGTIRADNGQLQQVLVNLVVNARDAMPEGGHLGIETRCLEVDDAVASLCPGMTPGTYALLTVSDTGTGMDELTRDRIFDPFFTTKAAGVGTGLGLAVVYGIVQQCGGFIHVYSEPGDGTVFRLYFPAEPVIRGVLDPAAAAVEECGGSETVLLVEDEAMLRTMLTFTLEHLGYHVLCPADGLAAVELCREFHGHIHLLVSDLVMPGMNGRVLAERLRASRPALRVLLMSGYTDEMVLRNAGAESGYAFIQKPFQLNSLARKVRDVLDQSLSPPRLPRGNGRVLVVDDDANTRETLIELLTEEGYRAEAASDGRKALECLRNGALPDVILLDLRMPAMNGWVFRIEQRKDPAIANIPVVLLSGAHDPVAAANFLDAPDFLVKPFDVEQLLALVAKHCAR